MIQVIGKSSVPTYLFADIDMTWAENLRLRLKETGQKTTVTAIMLKAIAIAQRSHPLSRTAILPWGRTVTFHEIIAGFTVERFVQSKPAVFFGAIDKPDTKSVVEIAEELKGYAFDEFPKVPQLDLQDRFNYMPWLFRRLVLWLGMSFPGVRLQCQGATFGLSSLGKFGVKLLIPPCVSTSTFGVGSVEDRAVVRDGKVEVRKMMSVSLNFDHRVLDGAPAARFLKDVIELMEGGLENYMQTESAPQALTVS